MDANATSRLPAQPSSKRESCRADAGLVQPHLRDAGAMLDCIEDAFDGVVLHGNKEARRELVTWCTCNARTDVVFPDVNCEDRHVDGLQGSFEDYPH